jgi:N-acetylglucosaminyldiphosphoundecaprenol N-acetyl-beta-D-mannosaminyltransferase
MHLSEVSEPTTRNGLDGKYNVLDIPIHALQIPGLISRMKDWIANGQYGRCITFANVHVVMEAQRDTHLRTILTDEGTVNVPDGMPLIWLGRGHGFTLPRRVYGPDLMYEFCKETAECRYRHFFYGGAEGVPEEMISNFSKTIGQINVVGTYSPPFRPLTTIEDERVVEMINRAKPDVLWLGLGCPKQEKWAFEHRHLLKVPIIASVGQAFDIYAGRVQQAPSWMRDGGLEWAFRLATNPKRLWRRYVIFNSLFLVYCLTEKLNLRNSGVTT